MRTIIYHNPGCSKSRDALKFLNDSGIDPEIVLYLESGWETETLKSLKTNSGLTWETILRAEAAKELRTAIASADEQVIIDYILTNPVALERPFVTTAKGTRLCRPITRIFEIVDQRPASPWFTEKGEQVL
jgi:arsenate reductase (glutaredoxin)